MEERIYKCEDVLILLGELVLGILADDDRDGVESHLAECPSCSAELDTLRALYSAMEPLKLARPDDGFERRIAAGVRRAISGDHKAVVKPTEERRAWWQIPGLIPGLAVATAAALTVVVFFAMIPLFGGLSKMAGKSEPSLITSGETTGTRDVIPEEVPLPSIHDEVTHKEKAPAERGEAPAPATKGPVDRTAEVRVPTAGDRWVSGMGGLKKDVSATGDDEVATDFDAEYIKAAEKKDVFQRRLAAYWKAKRGAGGAGSPPGYVAGVNGGRPPDGWKDPKVSVDLSEIEGGDEALAEYTAFDEGVSVYFLYEAPAGTQEEVIEDLRKTDTGAEHENGH
jgi:anti-sigma factor RsiW